MIVIIGSTALRGSGSAAAADGLSADIGRAAVAEGAHVELIGKIGDDRAGDALMVALARIGIGHVATLRDPSRATVVRVGDDDGPDGALDPAPAEGTGEPETTAATAAVTATAAAVSLAPVLEPADVALALRYVTDFRVVIAVHAAREVLAEAVSATAWAEADLVVVREPGSGIPDGLPTDALVIELAESGAAGGTDAGGIGAGALLGRYAAAVDRGDDRSTAFAAMTAGAAAAGSA